MRIRVCGVNTPVTDDRRRYAEYRIFTSVVPHQATIHSVDVAIARVSGSKQPSFRCTVLVDLGSSGCIRTQARAVHPGAAIDRAADRTAWLVRRRLADPSA
jgi:ribosome-associated translation inhibitor RaiA